MTQYTYVRITPLYIHVSSPISIISIMNIIIPEGKFVVQFVEISQMIPAIQRPTYRQRGQRSLKHGKYIHDFPLTNTIKPYIHHPQIYKTAAISSIHVHVQQWPISIAPTCPYCNTIVAHFYYHSGPFLLP